MRVTNSMLVGNLMSNLNTNMTKLGKLQNQLASGRKYANISDDPAAVIYSQAARNKLHRLGHYRKSLETAEEWLAQTESGIMELQEVIKFAHEANVQAATDVMNDTDKQNMADYIKQLRDQFVDALNTTFGDKYVFGGYNTVGTSVQTSEKGPFSVREVNGEDHLFYNDYDATVGGMPGTGSILSTDVLSFDVGTAATMEVSVNGLDLIFFNMTDENNNSVTHNAFDVLNNLYQKAKEGAPADELGTFIDQLQGAQNHLLTKASEIGGRTNRLELLSARYDQDELNYMQMRSNAEDAEYSEVIMNQKMAESIYQAALSAGAQIIQPTLMDFLR